MYIIFSFIFHVLQRKSYESGSTSKQASNKIAKKRAKRSSESSMEMAQAQAPNEIDQAQASTEMIKKRTEFSSEASSKIAEKPHQSISHILSRRCYKTLADKENKMVKANESSMIVKVYI